MTKLVAVDDGVYAKLRKLRGGESFSRTIDRLIESKSGNINKYFGVWRNRTDLDEIEEEISASRKSFGRSRKISLKGA